MKEILDWIFDGVARMIILLPKKLRKIRTTVKQATHKGYIKFKDLESSNIKLRYAAMVIPWANKLLHPIIAVLIKKQNIYCLSLSSKLT